MDGEVSANEKNSAPVGVTSPGSVRLTTPPDLFLFHPANHLFLAGVTTQPELGPALERMNPVIRFLIWSVAIGLFVYGAFGLTRFVLLNFAGETAPGIVTDFRSKVTEHASEGSSKRTSTSYYVTYSFSVGKDNERVYSNEVGVDKATYYRLGPGSPVEIVYWKGNPSISNIANNTAFPIISVVILVAVSTLAALRFAGLIRTHRHGEIGEHGQVRFGVLTVWDVDQMNAGQGVSYWDILAEYHFETPDGQMLCGIERFSTADASMAANKRGKHVAVVYLSEKSYAVL